MNFKSISWVMAGLLTALVSVNTWAGSVVCTPGVFSYSEVYSTSTVGATVKQVNVNVTCVRDSTGTDGTVSYQVTFNNGINAGAGTQNKAFNGALTLNYEFYKDSACLPINKLEGTTTLDVVGQPATSVAKANSTVVTPLLFYACIPAGQTAAASSVTYSDTIILSIAGTSSSPSVSYSSGPASTTNSVSIIAPPVCSISTPPGNISLNYTAFQASSAKGNTLFRVTCSNGLAYTTKITDINNTVLVTDAVAAGLNYSLGVSTTSGGTPVTSNPMTFTGTGNALDGYIIVTIPANQAGSCLGGCSQTNTHYLTLEY